MKLVINKKYPYKHYNRFSDTTGRKYLVDNVKVPSVTAILSATKDMRQLNNWRRRVGEKEADKQAWRFIYNTVIDPELLAYLELDKDDRIAITQ